jgi:hypothetical protein
MRNDKIKLTLDGLPIVDGRTADVFARDLNRRLCMEGDVSGRNYCEEVASRVSKENPNLSALYLDFRDNCLLHSRGPKVEPATALMLGFILAYEGLRRQGENNELESSF